MSVFLGNLIPVSGTKSVVGRIYYNPAADYQPTDGPGVTVDSLPAPQPPAGMTVANTYVDTNTKEVTYGYVTQPPSDSDRIAALEQTQAQAVLALVQGGLM